MVAVKTKKKEEVDFFIFLCGNLFLHGQLQTVGIRPCHDGAGRIQQKKTNGQRPVNLGGLLSCQNEGGGQHPRSDCGAYPKPGRRVSAG